MTGPALNTPEARQGLLRDRAAAGAALVLADLAREFGVSPDTIRRDLLALETGGVVQRVRGGALPVSRPVRPLRERLQTANPVAERLAAAALPLIEDGMVLLMDGGTTVIRLAQSLPPLPRALVVTPTPAIAMATLGAGIETMLIGGRISPFGGIAVGADAVAAVERVVADLSFLGACGLNADFGLSADDIDEAALKRAMAGSGRRSIVMTGQAKLGRRARHRVCGCDELDILITDAPRETAAPFIERGLDVRTV
ncbi:DeoR/GlpR family DNA-binding transcription regulator [Tropicimonas sp.]|uniref:DeoR/GlpR family DNA-binding transcription regulator n=1 Tax=Tropicimonas sp. TaxID=2067044 RepID=UPI003A84B9FE